MMKADELDIWIAEHVFDFHYDEELQSWCGRDEGGERFLVQSVAFTSEEFARVKREIARRGWIWQVISPVRGQVYSFAIYDPSGNVTHDLDGKAVAGARTLAVEHAETEELAGCCAFKVAVEVMDVEDTG